MAEDNDEAIPYCVATGEIRKLVTFFRGRGQLLEALIIAQVPMRPDRNGLKGFGKDKPDLCFQGACEGNIRAPQNSPASNTTNDVDSRQHYQRFGFDDPPFVFQPVCNLNVVACHVPSSACL